MTALHKSPVVIATDAGKKRLATRIRERLRATGMTVTSAARSTSGGISQSALYAYSRGKIGNPHTDALYEVDRAMMWQPGTARGYITITPIEAFATAFTPVTPASDDETEQEIITADPDLDAELTAMRDIVSALENSELDIVQQRRVLRWALDRFGAR